MESLRHYRNMSAVHITAPECQSTSAAIGKESHVIRPSQQPVAATFLPLCLHVAEHARYSRVRRILTISALPHAM